MTRRTTILSFVLFLCVLLTVIHWRVAGRVRVVDASVYAEDNSNTVFRVCVVTKRQAGPDCPPFPLPSGKSWCSGSWGNDAFFTASGLNRDDAEAVAGRLHVGCRLRWRPGYKLVPTLRPLKDSYGSGDQVLAIFDLRNVGEESIRFRVVGRNINVTRAGEQQREVDSGEQQREVTKHARPMSCDGPIDIEIWPDYVSGVLVDLSRWCSFSESGEYNVTCVCRTQILPPSRGFRWKGQEDEPLWDDAFEADTRIIITTNRPTRHGA